MADNTTEKLHNIVYKTTNLINGKIYIGCHCTNKLNDCYLGSGLTLKKAIKKYGKENFSRETLHDVDNSELAYFIEELLVDDEFIKREDTYNVKNGGTGGYNMTGKKHKAETLKKMSDSHKGLKHTEKAIEKISEAKKGKTFSEEHKRNLSIAHVGFSPSEETRKKLSEATKKSWETRRK